MPAPTQRTLRRIATKSCRIRPFVEALEDRFVPSATILEPVQNDTLVAAQLLDRLEADGTVHVDAAIGDNAFRGADVDAYTFTLTQAAEVAFAGTNGIVLSVFNSEDPFQFLDRNYQVQDGHRLIAQSAVGDANVHMQLPPGTYYVVVSGEGNRWFSPVLADSGLIGQEGEYQLDATVTALDLTSDSGPRVLYGTFDQGSVLSASPHWIHLALSQDIDPSSSFNIYDSNGNEWYAWWTNFSFTTHEIQAELINPLPSGDYQFVVTGMDGELMNIAFSVAGIEGGDATDDTIDTAKNLGVIPAGVSASVYGAIGDDPSYNLFLGDPFLADPSSDVDMVRFEVTGTGPQSVVIEAYAGRIGSPLQPGLALFRQEADGSLTVVAGARGVGNALTSASGSTPLKDDALLVLALEPGVYFLAVTNNNNIIPEGSGFLYGQDGFFDPQVSHSGWNMGVPGQYVVNISVAAPNDVAPTVQSITPSYADNGSLTGMTVKFSDYVNLPALANQGIAVSHSPAVTPIYLRALDASGVEVGPSYYPGLVNFDSATNTAQLVMLDPLPPGIYALHLSGSAGLTNLWGTALAGNDASGDYVEWLEVTGPEITTPVAVESGHESEADAQDVGVIFARDLQSGFVVQRSADAGMNDEADYFKIQVLQNGIYTFLTQGLDAEITISDANGPLNIQGSAGMVTVDLTAGVYWVRVGSWDTNSADSISYDLVITGSPQENPVPLSLGAAPAARLQIRPLPPATDGLGSFPPPSDVGTGTGDGSTSPTPPTIVVTLPPPASIGSSVVTVTPGAVPGPGTVLVTLASIPRSIVGSAPGVNVPSGVLSGLATTPTNVVQSPTSPISLALAQLLEHAYFLLDMGAEKTDVEEETSSMEEEDMSRSIVPPMIDAGETTEMAEARQAPELWVIPLESTPRQTPTGSLGAFAFFAGLLLASPTVKSAKERKARRRSSKR